MGAKQHGSRYNHITSKTFGTYSYRTLENYIDDYAGKNGLIDCANLINIAASAASGSKARIVASKAIANALVKAGCWYAAAGITAASYIAGAYYSHQRNTLLSWKKAMANKKCDKFRISAKVYDIGQLQGASVTRSYTETKHTFEIIDNKGNVVETLYDYMYS